MDDSDYKDFKIAESNVGYQMLKKFGWSEGEGYVAYAWISFPLT